MYTTQGWGTRANNKEPVFFVCKPGVGDMRLVRLGAFSAIKVKIVVKDRIRDRVTFKISDRAKVWAGES